MIGDFIQAVAAKWGGEFAPDSAVWSQTANSIVDLELTIPEKWVGYLIYISGYTNGEGVKVTFYDHDNMPRWEWTEFIDTEVHTYVLPFLEKWYRDTIKFRFENTSTATRTIGFYVVVLLIPEANRIEFENNVKSLANLIPVLENIAGKLEVRKL